MTDLKTVPASTRMDRLTFSYQSEAVDQATHIGAYSCPYCEQKVEFRTQHFSKHEGGLNSNLQGGGGRKDSTRPGRCSRRSGSRFWISIARSVGRPSESFMRQARSGPWDVILGTSPKSWKQSNGNGSQLPPEFRFEVQQKKSASCVSAAPPNNKLRVKTRHHEGSEITIRHAHRTPGDHGHQ